MNQFRAVRNQYGNLYIEESIRTPFGYLWRGVCLRQLNQKTGQYE